MNKNTTHTPAPWLMIDGNFVYSLNNDKTNRFDCAIRRGYIKQGYLQEQYERTSQEEIEANAALICAAPDLLAACELFIELFDNSDMRPEDESYEVAYHVRNAINKAKNISQP